jgi:hypothetical protein
MKRQSIFWGAGERGAFVQMLSASRICGDGLHQGKGEVEEGAGAEDVGLGLSDMGTEVAGCDEEAVDDFGEEAIGRRSRVTRLGGRAGRQVCQCSRERMMSSGARRLRKVRAWSGEVPCGANIVGGAIQKGHRATARRLTREVVPRTLTEAADCGSRRACSCRYNLYCPLVQW